MSTTVRLSLEAALEMLGADEDIRREIVELETRSARLAELAGAVTEMRGHQRDYFRERSRESLQASKAAERKVDKLLAELDGTNKQGRLL